MYHVMSNEFRGLQTSVTFDPLFVRNIVSSSLRIGLLLILQILQSVSYDIIKPLTVPIIW